MKVLEFCAAVVAILGLAGSLSAGPRTVASVKAELDRSPKRMMGVTLELEAYVLGHDMVKTLNEEVTRCANFMVLGDPDPAVIAKLPGLDSQTRTTFFASIPTLKSTEITPGGVGAQILPTKYAVYRGRFVEDCDGIRFKIERKVREIPLGIKWPERDETVPTGMVIAQGKLLLPPLQVRVSQGEVTVNGESFTLAPPLLTPEAVKQVEQNHQRLVAHLKRGGSLMYSGKSAGIQFSTPKPFPVEKISQIVAAHETKEWKRIALQEALGGGSLQIRQVDEFVARWSASAPAPSAAAGSPGASPTSAPADDAARLAARIQKEARQRLEARQGTAPELLFKGKAVDRAGQPRVEVTGNVPHAVLAAFIANLMASDLAPFAVEAVTVMGIPFDIAIRQDGPPPEIVGVSIVLRRGSRTELPTTNRLEHDALAPVLALLMNSGAGLNPDGVGPIQFLSLDEKGSFHVTWFAPSEDRALDSFEELSHAPLLGKAWLMQLRNEHTRGARAETASLKATLDGATPPTFPERKAVQKIHEVLDNQDKVVINEFRFDPADGDLGVMNVSLNLQLPRSAETPVTGQLGTLAEAGSLRSQWKGTGNLRNLDVTFRMKLPPER